MFNFIKNLFKKEETKTIKCTYRTCKTCKNLIYPTMVGYSCKKIGRWGTDIPLHDGGSCKKWKLTNRRDNVNGFVPAEPFKPGVYYRTKNAGLYIADDGGEL